MYNTLIITNLIQLSYLKTLQEITGIVKSFNHVINIDQYFFYLFTIHQLQYTNIASNGNVCVSW